MNYFYIYEITNIKKFIKKIIQNEFTRRLGMSLLNVKFVMIHLIEKILVLIKNHINYLKDNIFECFFKKYNRFFFK